MDEERRVHVLGNSIIILEDHEQDGHLRWPTRGAVVAGSRCGVRDAAVDAAQEAGVLTHLIWLSSRMGFRV